jgi:hypothetical protein
MNYTNKQDKEITKTITNRFFDCLSNISPKPNLDHIVASSLHIAILTMINSGCELSEVIRHVEAYYEDCMKLIARYEEEK